MTEPQDSYTALQTTMDAYKAGTSTANDVKQAILNAVQQGNDPQAVATYVNEASPPPAGFVWYDPNPNQLYPPAVDVKVDLTDDLQT